MMSNTPFVVQIKIIEGNEKQNDEDLIIKNEGISEDNIIDGTCYKNDEEVVEIGNIYEKYWEDKEVSDIIRYEAHNEAIICEENESDNDSIYYGETDYVKEIHECVKYSMESITGVTNRKIMRNSEVLREDDNEKLYDLDV